MTNTLVKRGPDDKKLWMGEHVALGHTRLVVIDPEGGKQPMQFYSDGQCWTIIYNGELYNTEELRKELEQEGFAFRSHSDTEVLLKAYVRWGAACLDKINGIFAFAVWNDRDLTLFLARDRLGVKPLFFTEKNGALIFGSELKAILAHPDIRAEVDRDGLAEVLGLGPSRTPGHGIFKGIRELRPGHALIWRPEGFKVFRYWQVKSRPHEDSLAETVEKVRLLIMDAVKRQLVSDVPVSTFLSGGVDSSTISAIAAKHFTEEPLDTFSIDYIENERYFARNDFQPDPDGPYIEKMTKYIGSNHHKLLIGPEELFHYLEEAMIVRDQPGMADIDSSLLWFCKQIRKRATVALSGECADEIFGGYPWFYRNELLHKDAFPWMVSIDQRENVLREEWKQKLRLGDYIYQRYRETLAEVPVLDEDTEDERRRREMFYLNMVWFMAGLLDRKDRMSMGAGLEVRVPFADHRLVEYVWNIPWKIKRLHGREKGLLRQAMEGLLPDEVLYRKKSPYPKTFHPMYTQLVRDKLLSIMEDKESPLFEVIDRDALRALSESEAFVERPWFGQLMRGPQVMAYYIQLYAWFKAYNVNIV
jgi:asparagine synthase (glutamine-hydrolysing)